MATTDTQNDACDFGIGPMIMEDFMSGAWFIAILCFPTMKDTSARWALAKSLGSGSLYRTLMDEPERHEEFVARYPELMAVPEAARRKGERRMHTLIRYRAAAGRMAQGFIRESHFRADPDLPPSMTRHSLNELAKLVIPDAGISDPENIIKQVWRPSIPVIHIASALQAVIRQRLEMGLLKPLDPMRGNFLVASKKAKEAGLADILEFNLQDSNLVRQVVMDAMQLEEAVRQDRRFGRHRHNIIQIRWRE